MSALRLVALGLLFLPACKSSSTTNSSADAPRADGISYPLADFTLTERSGKRISRDDLKGKVWIASFVFTRCTGPCPSVTSMMARLQAALADEKDVRLVTFTVDPERDNPEELRKYADARRADKERWLFLTGDEKEIHRLLQESFKVGAARNEKAKPGDEFTHSTRLAVVDKEGNVRGYFEGMLEGEERVAQEVAKIKQRVAELLRERSQ
jgi:cytochrome oxidase Cu insertion factor (SCO1/SenC/PrrC family)